MINILLSNYGLLHLPARHSCPSVLDVTSVEAIPSRSCVK